MTSMIERVAIALNDSRIFSDGEWGDLAPGRQSQLRMQARAALEALREPTLEMRRAGEQALRKVALTGDRTELPRDIWQAMVDSILEDAE